MTLFKTFWSPMLGACIWLICLLLWRPVPFEVEWAVSLLLFSPLVLIPLGFRLARQDSPFKLEEGLSRWIEYLQFPSTLFLVISYFFPQGNTFAILFSLPWLAMTGLFSLWGLIRVWKRGLFPLPELGIQMGFIFLSVGGGWTVLNRAGMRPLDFDAVIVLLTAIHFHYAGFALPLLTGLAGRTLPGMLSTLAILGSIVGVPLVATGITTSQLGWGNGIECFAACFLAISGLFTAYLYFQLFRKPVYSLQIRILWLIASVALTVSMGLAILYGCRFYFDLAWLDIPWMRAIHGSANALGFTFAGILGWTFVTSKTRS